MDAFVISSLPSLWSETLDALDPRFVFDAFKSAVSDSKRDVKSVLMDQRIMAGVGNIYSDELLAERPERGGFFLGRAGRTRLRQVRRGRSCS